MGKINKMKKTLPKFKYTFLAVAVVLVLVTFRLADGNRFRNGAEKNAAASLSGKNVLQPSDSGFLADNTLLVYIDNPKIRYNSRSNFIDVEHDDILNRDLVKQLKKHKGKIVLTSDYESVRARAWMLLAQKGVKNCYILMANTGEQFKHQFRPDTSMNRSEPELEL